jgi:hypothetical protein
MNDLTLTIRLFHVIARKIGEKSIAPKRHF